MAGGFSVASVFVLAALFATPAALDQPVAPIPSAIDAIYGAPALDTAVPEGTTDGPALQMIMVRVKDGKPVMACVDSKEAAERFLSAPISKIGGRAAEEK